MTAIRSVVFIPLLLGTVVGTQASAQSLDADAWTRTMLMSNWVVGAEGHGQDHSTSTTPPAGKAEHHQPGQAPTAGTTGHHHNHDQVLNVSAAQAPSVQLIVHPDAVKGWNLEIQVENFRFAPERVNTVSTGSEGHGHLYIDGQKVTRLYSGWYHLPTLAPGTHEIRVSLHGNNHEALAVQGQRVETTVTVQVPSDR